MKLTKRRRCSLAVGVAVAIAIVMIPGFCAGSFGAMKGTLNVAIVQPLATGPSAEFSHFFARGLVSTVLAIEHVNNKSDGLFDNLLPNTTIKYEFYDSKGSGAEVAKFAADLKFNAFDSEGADIVVGAAYSSHSVALQSFIKFFSLPQVSPYSTSRRLSDTNEFPFFLRLVPTDKLLVTAMVEFATKTVGWKSAALVNGNDDYSMYGSLDLLAAAKDQGLNVLHRKIFKTGDPTMKLTDAVLTGTKLFIYFGQPKDIPAFLRELYRSLSELKALKNGFSILYADTYLGTDYQKIFQDSGESHIYEAMCNGTFALNFQLSSNFTSNFESLLRDRMKTLSQCNATANNKSCGCGDNMVDRRTNKSVLAYVAAGKEHCAELNEHSELSYYDPFAYDSVVLIASAIHNMVHKKNFSRINAEEFVKTATSLNFNVTGGATGTLRLGPNGDRGVTGVAFDVWNSRVGKPAGTGNLYVGKVRGSGSGYSFNFCKMTGANDTVGQKMVLCHPSLSFNTLDNRAPVAPDKSLTTIRIGLVVSTFKASFPFQADVTGSQRVMVMLMAIDEISNKTDGIYDHLLPSTYIEVEWRNSRRDEATAAVAASRIMSVGFSGNGADVVIGAFSSGPSMEVQNILKHSKTLQISPSSTSVDLSDNTKYPFFLRTVPSDLNVIRGMVALACEFLNWNAFGLITDDSAYSRGGLEHIAKEVALRNLKISLHVKLKATLKNLDTEVNSVLRSNTRGFLVFLNSDQTGNVLRALASRAEALGVKASAFSFVFNEGILAVKKIPTISNGSFAVLPRELKNKLAQGQMKARADALVKRIQLCVSGSSGSKTECDCIPLHWRSIFLVQSNASAPDKTVCSFPKEFNMDEYYSPYSYDAVLAAAHLHQDLRVRKNAAKITSEMMKNNAVEPSFAFEGVTGTVRFSSNGDRGGDFGTAGLDGAYATVMNVLASASERNLSSVNHVGHINKDDVFSSCNASTDAACVREIHFGTASGMKPKAVSKACTEDADCNGNGKCADGGFCICSSGHIGINCQHLLFERTVFSTNFLGSERCLKLIQPISNKSAREPVRVCLLGWESQTLVSELSSLLMTELMNIPVTTVSYLYGRDYIKALSTGECHVVLEDWDRKYKDSEKLYIETDKSVQNLGGVGYYGRDGWFMNTAALEVDRARAAYLSFRKADTISAMNNITLQQRTIQNCSGSGQSLCNAQTGTFTNDLVCTSGTDCGIIMSPESSYAEDLLQRQITSLQLRLKVWWLGTKNMQEFIQRNIESENPLLFYWWNPDKFLASFEKKSILRVKLPDFSNEIWKSTGGCDFPQVTMRKLVSSKLPKDVMDLVSNFKLSQTEIDELLLENNAELKEQSASCRMMRKPAFREKVLTFIPSRLEDFNVVRIAVGLHRVSSLIVGKLLETLLEDHLRMEVRITYTTNDMHSIALVSDRDVDIAAEVLFFDGAVSSLTDQIAKFRKPYSDQAGLYTFIPDTFGARAREVATIWYLGDDLVRYLPHVGMYSPSPVQCRLWWCNDLLGRPGTFYPSYCSSKRKACAEILVSSSLNGFPRLSILAEIIEALELPFVIVFVDPLVLETAMKNSSHLTLFFSGERLKETTNIARFNLPPYSPKCLASATETKYSIDKPTLGSYNCDFPTQSPYVVGNNNIYDKPDAFQTLLSRMQLQESDLQMIKDEIKTNFSRPSDLDITKQVNKWLDNNNETWKQWIAGCAAVGGKYGILGKCKNCPRGKYSTASSNICELCPSGTFAANKGSSKCTLCPAKTVTLKTGSVNASQCLCVDGLMGSGIAACSPCPKNGVCRQGSVWVPNGYWRFEQDSTEIFRCPKPSMCRGVAVDIFSSNTVDFEGESVDHEEGCAPLHEGNLCSKCKKWHFRTVASGLTCDECYSGGVLALVHTVTAILVIILIYTSIRFSRGSPPRLRHINAKLQELRKQLNAQDVCVYISEVDSNCYRFLDHARANDDFELARRRSFNSRRISVVGSFFNVAAAYKLASANDIEESDNFCGTSAFLPNTIDVRDYPYIDRCVKLVSHRTVRDPAAPELKLFEIGEGAEINIFPITTDLKQMGGIIIVTVLSNSSSKDMDLTQETMFKYVGSSGHDLISQCEDHAAILLKILLCHIQVYAVTKSILVPWSTQAMASFETSEAVSSLFASLLANACSLDYLCGGTKKMNCRALLIFVLPLLVFVLLYLMAMVALVIRALHRRAEINFRLVKQSLNSLVGIALIIILYYSHGAITSVAFSMIPCRQLGTSGAWMTADYDTPCDSPSQTLWTWCMLVPVFFVYVLGIPAAVAFMVYMNRNALGHYNTRRYIGILYNGYKLKYYWWEAVILLRKSSIIGAVHIFSTYGISAQTTLVLLFITISLMVEYSVQPYAWSLLAETERLSLIVQGLSFFAASLAGSESFQNEGGRTFVEISISLLNITFVSVTVCRCLYYYREALVRQLPVAAVRFFCRRALVSRQSSKPNTRPRAKTREYQPENFVNPLRDIEIPTLRGEEGNQRRARKDTNNNM
jgi:ABC-type branched-subunit amino acid transport system substrate-binding protein/ABC-type proline/glycine betaine transport system substrate-binding protein